MTLALLCSGQGHQHAGMFDLTADAPEAGEIFVTATRALDGRDPRRFVRDGAADLHLNRTGQVLCCAQALAAHAALRDILGDRLIVAGYSVGELASWGCAGVITPAAVLDLAIARAAAMDAASGPDDGLGYVRGLARARVDALCAAHGVAVAIINPGDLFVIGGARPAVEAVCTAAAEAGAAHVGLLKVSVASHTARLAAASETFRSILGRTPTTRLVSHVRLVSGLDGTTVRVVADGLDRLARQISQAIDWAGCIEACLEAGMTAALELGPGNALAGMVAARDPNVNARSLDDFRSLEGVRRWLGALFQ